MAHRRTAIAVLAPPFPKKPELRGWPLRGPIYPTAPFSEIGHFRSLFSEASINPTASNFDFIESSWSLLPSRFYGMSKFKKLWILWPFENGRFWARNVSPLSSSSSSSSCYSVPPIFFGLPMVWGFPNLAHSFLGTFPRGVFWKIPKFLIPSSYGHPPYGCYWRLRVQIWKSLIIDLGTWNLVSRFIEGS